MSALVAPQFIRAKSIGMVFATRPTLSNVDFSIEAGEFVSIVGPSGCGKSTLLRLLAGLTVPSSGQLTVADLEPPTARRGPCRVAFVFQDPTLLPWRTVRDNVRLPLELRGEAGHPQSDQQIHEALDLVGLAPDDAKKRPRKLSGGMRMRASLARALVTRPNLLLLDEPFAALDEVLRQQLNEDLSRIWLDRRWTAVFVTHNVSEAVFMSQRVLVMTRRPGTILHEVATPFPFPRTHELRAEPEFARLSAEVSLLLREASR